MNNLENILNKIIHVCRCDVRPSWGGLHYLRHSHAHIAHIAYCNTRSRGPLLLFLYVSDVLAYGVRVCVYVFVCANVHVQLCVCPVVHQSIGLQPSISNARCFYQVTDNLLCRKWGGRGRGARGKTSCSFDEYSWILSLLNLFSMRQIWSREIKKFDTPKSFFVI